MNRFFVLVLSIQLLMGASAAEQHPPVFNRAPLMPKPYAAFAAGVVQPEGWLKAQLQRMAAGMTGRLDELYPEVVGSRNAWLGGDGDAWERGPYWIDGLLPLAHQLGDENLLAKARPWIEWTIENQREDGYLGPRPTAEAPTPEPGLQRNRQEDWWPRMVMLKILQTHYMSTGDERVPHTLLRYFRYQLDSLPEKPLDHWTWWGRERGGDNLLVVLWIYNLTGEPWLLDLARLIVSQTHPYTEAFLSGEQIPLRPDNRRDDDLYRQFHCVNLAQGMKTPHVSSQIDGDMRHNDAVVRAWRDIERFHGQPHGLYGGDEAMHGRDLSRGSELCTAVEMMFSLETMLEISGRVAWADRLEKIAYNMLPTQISDDALTRQYFQQANQVHVTYGERDFFNDGGDRLVYGLLDGYPCCTSNLHQGWPKLVQHLFMASADGGLAALVYGPSRISAVLGGRQVTVTEKTGYPFRDQITFAFSMERAAEFPFHLRIPGWCDAASIHLNGERLRSASAGEIVVLDRTWRPRDQLEIHLPMILRRSYWEERAVAIERGPLVFALRVGEAWHEVADDGGRPYRECTATTPWNYALVGDDLNDFGEHFRVEEIGDDVPENPWTLETAPLVIHARGHRLPGWTLDRNSAGRTPLSPVNPPQGEPDSIKLIPYGCTTLRVTGFPWTRPSRQ